MLYHFLPHPIHKKRAALLSSHAFGFYLIGLFLFFATFKTLPKVMPGILGYASNITTSDLYNLTNQTRAEKGLPPLNYNSTLSIAAQKKAEDMFKNDYWAHISPQGKKPWDFILAVNYDYEYAGENLAKNFDNSNAVVKAWYESKSHRENLLNPNYEDMGFAVVNGVLNGYETTLVVQMFGTLRDSAYLANANDQVPVSLAPAEQVPVASPHSQNIQIPSPLGTSSLQTNVLNVSHLPNYLVLGFLTFLVILLLVDIWYSKKKGILKLTGHTFAHIIFLIFTLSAVLLSLNPGKIL